MQYVKKSHIQVTSTSRKLDFLFMKSKWRNASIWQSDPAVSYIQVDRLSCLQLAVCSKCPQSAQQEIPARFYSAWGWVNPVGGYARQRG